MGDLDGTVDCAHVYVQFGGSAMTYESIHPASPFRQKVEQVLPEVLKPLRYCEFRNPELHDRPVSLCDTFACLDVLDMVFCYQHAKLILSELASEGAGDGD